MRPIMARIPSGGPLLPYSDNGWQAAAGPRAPAVYPFYVILVIFLVALPKGGIAVGDMPVTFGYLLLGLLAPPAVLVALRRGGPPPAALANFFFGFVPVAAMAMLKLLGAGSMSSSLIYAVILFILPALFLLVYSPVLEMLSEEQIGTPLKWALRFVAVWGLMNFLIFAFTKTLVEIPYLTVNPLNAGEIYAKNNSRGMLMKLVSTYNNGNVFGVCVLMLLPIYRHFEKSRLWLGLLVLAIVLSLSRTVWAGLVVAMIGMIWSGQLKLTRPAAWISLGGVVLLVIALLPLMGWTTERVVDTEMGGRMLQWDQIELSFLGQPQVRISEVLYAGLLQSFGLLGTLLAVIAFAFPLVYGVINADMLSPLRRAAVVSVACYLLMAMSDAAFIYPPTIAILLAVSTLVYRRGLRGEAPAAPAIAPRRTIGPMTLAEAAARIR